MTSNLRAYVKHKLINRSRQVRYVDIAKETGLSADWIERLANDKSQKASAEKLETLYRYFEGKELTL